MANMNLVTGYAGKGHVTAADQGALYAAMFGSGDYVLSLGEKFAATKRSDNSVRIASGEALLQGRHARIDNGLYVDLAVESGTAGYLRNDLVCIRYTKNGNTGVEEANMVIVRGTPVAAAPSDPSYTKGNLLSGATQRDFPIYRLRLNGITLETIEPLFDAAFPNFHELVQGFWYKTVTVGTSWTKDTANGGHYQVVQLEGISAADHPFVDVVLGSDIAANIQYLNSWSAVTRVVAGDNKLTLYANGAAPETALTMQVKVVR